jgi:glucose-6-phosphate isomerase
MLTSNIRLINFKKIKKKIFKNKLKKFKKINFVAEYPLLETLTNNYKYSYSKSDINKFKKNSTIRLIGMGGSILGAETIYQFLNHKIKKKFIFLNNLKPNLLEKNKSKKKVNLIISKSGNTIETILNSSYLINQNKKNKNIFITEKKNNYLFNLADKLKSEIIEHKNYIGGRYSVLSEVGMLPAELMGLKARKFKRFNHLINNNNFISQLICNVESTLKFTKQKKFNSIILNYDERSENLFKWYQQLIAESLGKKSKGILPIISMMPRDNHSLLQLYLDGPKINFFTFFSVIEKDSNKIKDSIMQNSYPYLKNKSFIDILCAQRQATQKIFKKKKIPFRSFEIIKRNEESLGELFCFFILETILLGRALKVNLFDQPSVELIKKETKKILIS